mgnify:FL=1
MQTKIPRRISTSGYNTSTHKSKLITNVNSITLIQLPQNTLEQVDLVINEANHFRASKGSIVTKDELITYLTLWASGLTKREIAESQDVDFLRVQNAMNKMLDMTEIRELRWRFPRHARNRKNIEV